MKRISLHWLIAPVLIVASLGSAAAVDYRVLELGCEVGSYPASMNNKGQVVLCRRDGDTMRPVLWDNGLAKDLAPIGDSSMPYCINDSEQVVGTANTSGGSRAVLWERGTVKSLTMLSSYCEAHGINNKGQIVGSWSSDSAPFGAVLWQNDTTRQLPADGRRSAAQAINESGQIVGCTFDGNLSQRAVTWENGTLKELTAYGLDSSAADINNLGQVVGYARDSSGLIQAVVWENGKMRELSGLDNFSCASSINDRGQIVGYAYDANGKAHAILWDNGNVQDLSLPDVNSLAVSIDSDGHIAGYYSTMGSPDYHPVVWEPLPLPSSSIGGARRLSSHFSVAVDDAVVTAVGLEPGVVFVEASGRSSGIKLRTSHQLTVGQRIKFCGVPNFVDGEYQFTNVDIESITDGKPLEPVGMTTATIGNDTTQTLSYLGINTSGLLVRVAGRITARFTPGGFCYMDDGAGYSDGMSSYWPGVRVRFPSGFTMPDKGKRVIVTGISRVEKAVMPVGGGDVNGDWYPEGTVVYIPTIWVRDAADLRIVK